MQFDLPLPDGERITLELIAPEHTLMALLADRLGKPVPYGALGDASKLSDERVRHFAASLRARLAHVAPDRAALLTSHGIGYALVPDDPQRVYAIEAIPLTLRGALCRVWLGDDHFDLPPTESVLLEALLPTWSGPALGMQDVEPLITRYGISATSAEHTVTSGLHTRLNAKLRTISSRRLGLVSDRKGRFRLADNLRSVGPLTIAELDRRVSGPSGTAALTRGQLAILRCLAVSPTRALPRRDLMRMTGLTSSQLALDLRALASALSTVGGLVLVFDGEPIALAIRVGATAPVATAPASTPETIGPFLVDRAARTVTHRGRTVRLSAANLRITLTLAANLGKGVSRADLRDPARGGSVDLLAAQIAQLRRALQPLDVAIPRAAAGRYRLVEHAPPARRVRVGSSLFCGDSGLVLSDGTETVLDPGKATYAAFVLSYAGAPLPAGVIARLAALFGVRPRNIVVKVQPLLKSSRGRRGGSASVLGVGRFELIQRKSTKRNSTIRRPPQSVQVSSMELGLLVLLAAFASGVPWTVLAPRADRDIAAVDDVLRALDAKLQWGFKRGIRIERNPRPRLILDDQDS